MGAVFSAGVGSIAAAAAGTLWLFSGMGPVAEYAKLVTAMAIWAFPIGVAFSGVVALTARGRSFERLSLPRFMAIGAGAGLLLYGVLAMNAWDAWTVRNAIGNAVILVGMGSGSAAVSLLLARKASPTLEAGEKPLSLREGGGTGG
jgi:hypothetical protein